MGIAGTIQTASIGIPDTLFLMLLALVVFGPRRLPEIGRQIGKLMYEFRKVSNDFKYQMEEELRASEEADRQKKLKAEAAAQVTLNVPPQPVTEVAAEALPAHTGDAEAPDQEERGEPRKFPPDVARIQPPSSGEVVAAQRPFRAAAEESANGGGAALPAEVATESGDAPARTVDTPVIVADEGRIGTEAQPGVPDGVPTHAAPENVADTGREREAHHA